MEQSKEDKLKRLRYLELKAKAGGTQQPTTMVPETEPSLGSKLSTIAKSIPSNIAQGLAEGGITRAITKSAGLEVTPKQLIESEALPIAGGIAGGTLGATAGYLGTGGLASGTLAVGGAGLGGAAGEALRQLGARGLKKLGQDVNVPETATEAAKKIGREGLVQGAAALAGEIAAPAATYIAGKIIPQSSQIGSEFINTPLSLARSRLEKGKKRVADEILSNPENRKFITNDKEKILDLATSEIKILGKQADDIINNFEKNIPEKIKPTVSKSQLGERPEVVDKIIDTLGEVKDDWDIGGQGKKLLDKIKGSKNIGFKDSNDFRKMLGDYIGKRFESQEVPEKMDAIISLWGNLRNKLGELSPKLNTVLNRQHDLFDIKNSVFNDVAKGRLQKPSESFWSFVRPEGLTGARNLKIAEDVVKNVSPFAEPTRRTVSAASAEVLDSIFGDKR